MARLASIPYPWKWREPGYDYPDFTSFKSVLEEEQEALDELIKKSAALPPGKIIGAVMNWPVADGRAYYIVIKENYPLTLQHIPFGDAWQVDPILIRGLRREDVIRMLDVERRFRDIWKKHAAEKEDSRNE